MTKKLSPVYTNSTQAPVPDTNENKRVLLGKTCSVISLLMLLSVFGVLNMYVAFYELFQTYPPNRTGDPKVMAGLISQALVPGVPGVPGVQGVIFALPGLLSALIAIFFTSYRSVLLFKYWIIGAILLLLLPPFGLVFGIVFAAILFFKRKNYQNIGELRQSVVN